MQKVPVRSLAPIIICTITKCHTVHKGIIVIQLSNGSTAVATQVNTNYSLTVASAKTWSRALLLL